MIRELKVLFNKFVTQVLVSHIYIPCPGCGTAIPFEEGRLFVNIESHQFVRIPGFLSPHTVLLDEGPCNNPSCKWSRKLNDV